MKVRPIIIRPLRWCDLSFVDRLRALTGWNQTREDWVRYLSRAEGDCAGFLALWRGKPAGVVTIIAYGDGVGWIGMLLVARAFRRHGIGRTLLIHAKRALEVRRVRCLKLDATPAGQPLYEGYGFSPEWLITRWESAGGIRVGPAPGAPSTSAREVRTDDLAAIGRLDARAFGADRLSLLRQFYFSGARCWCVVRGRELVGYGCLRRGSRAGYLGPVVAQTAVAAKGLVFALLGQSGGGTVYWDIPHPNANALRLAEGLGFKPQRQLLRMRAGGGCVAGVPSIVYGIADPSLG